MPLNFPIKNVFSLSFEIILFLAYFTGEEAGGRYVDMHELY